MRKMRFLVLMVFLLAVGLVGCVPGAGSASVPPTETSVPTEPAVPTATAVPSGPRLRIINAGERDLEGLVVIFPDSRIEFGDVPAGATTEYMAAPGGVYNYAAFEYVLNGEQMMQPVIDWMGESPRPGSDFTYTLVFNPELTNMLPIQLVQATVDR